MQKFTFSQKSKTSSPHSLSHKIRLFIWLVVQSTIFLTPKPLNFWRIILLRCFGTKINGKVFVSGLCKVKAPWNLKLEDGSCVGPYAEIYNIANVTIGEGSAITQYCYLCCGSHDLSDPIWPLVTAPIIIGKNVFIGAKSIILMGVTIGDHVIIGAGCVVAKDIPAHTKCIGNPCKIIN